MVVLDSGDKFKDKVLRISESSNYSQLKIDDDHRRGLTHDEQWTKQKVMVVLGSTSLLTVGYLLNVVGSVNTILLSSYSKEIHEMRFNNLFMTTSFLGSAFGHIIFGYMSDIKGRCQALNASVILLTIFATLSSLSLSEVMSLKNSLTTLAVMRFFLGVGIGGIMPTASVSTFEACKFIFAGRTRTVNNASSFYVLATSLNIDIGTFISSLVPWLLLDVFNVTHARRLAMYSLGVGIIPLIVVYSIVYFKWLRFLTSSGLRRKGYRNISGIQQPISPHTPPHELDSSSLPTTHIKKKFFFVTVTWFLYDIMIYPLSYYSSIILSGEPITKIGSQSLRKLLVLSLLVTISYIPGPLVASRLMQNRHPKNVLKIGTYTQTIVSFLMFSHALLSRGSYHPIVASTLLCVLLFSSELGLGSCIAMYANRSYPRNIRARLCSASSLLAKLGAFLGTLCFPYMNKVFTNNETLLNTTLYGIVFILTLLMILALRQLYKLENIEMTSTGTLVFQEHGHNTLEE